MKNDQKIVSIGKIELTNSKTVAWKKIALIGVVLCVAFALILLAVFIVCNNNKMSIVNTSDVTNDVTKKNEENVNRSSIRSKLIQPIELEYLSAPLKISNSDFDLIKKTVENNSYVASNSEIFQTAIIKEGIVSYKNENIDNSTFFTTNLKGAKLYVTNPSGLIVFFAKLDNDNNNYLFLATHAGDTIPFYSNILDGKNNLWIGDWISENGTFIPEPIKFDTEKQSRYIGKTGSVVKGFTKYMMVPQSEISDSKQIDIINGLPLYFGSLRSGINTFYFESLDGMIFDFVYQFDFDNDVCEVEYCENMNLIGITWEDGTQTVTSYIEAPINNYCERDNEIVDIDLTKQEIIGKTTKGDDIYGPKSTNDEALLDKYEYYKTSIKENLPTGETLKSLDEFYRSKPYFFVLDDYGYTHRFTNLDLYNIDLVGCEW